MTQRVDISICRADAGDIGAIYAIELASFTAPWSLEDFRAELEHDYAYLLAAKIGGRVAGFADMHIVVDDAHINNVAVDNACRRNGVGRALVDECIRLAAEHGAAALTLEVRQGNLAAVRMYEKAGFVGCGLRKRFYRLPDEDAVNMIYKGNNPCLCSE